MKEYTVIWEDRWQQGTHWHCMTHKLFVACFDISEVMKSELGNKIIYIFEGFQLTLGEVFDASRVEMF